MADKEIEKLKQNSKAHVKALFEDLLSAARNIAKELPKNKENSEIRNSLAATIRRTRRTLKSLP